MSSAATEEFRRIVGRHLERGVERPVPEYTVCVTNAHGYSYFTHQGKMEDAMNYSLSIFLINEEVRALYVQYGQNQGSDRTQRYMVKTFDKSIKVGDYVIVPSSMGTDNLSIATVSMVDVDPDYDSTTVVPWVVQKIDMAEFNELIKQEEVVLATIKKANTAARKRKLVKELHSMDELKALPLAQKRAPEEEEQKDYSWRV